MYSIDLNCDMGESFGAFKMGADAKLMDYVSSVNIACGFHAGDPTVMRKTVEMAVKKNVAIGAHPGYPDLQGFGRREMKLSSTEIYDIMVYQIGSLMAFTRAFNVPLAHVKPHGALYNAAAKDRGIAAAIAKAVYDVDKLLKFVGLSGSVMIEEAKQMGLETVSEVFSDRTYQDDGTLTPRTSTGASIENPQLAAKQVLQMVQQGTVMSVSGKVVPVTAETVCIHGDGKFAIDFAMAIVNTFNQNNVIIKHF